MTGPHRADGRAHAIACPHAAASAIGDAVFRAGGNAVDAAVAAAVALTVAYPHNCAVGGDIFALVSTPDGVVQAVNGSGAAAAGASAEQLVAAFGSMPLVGPHTVTVPGAVAAWESLLELGGSRPLADLIAPAIALAADGTTVAPSLAAAIVQQLNDLAADPGMAAVFLPDGRPLAAGDRLVQPALARSLETIARDGAGAFYVGPIGASIVARLHELGAPITLADLAAHATEVGPPLVGSFRGDEVLTAPPNSSGLLLLETLAALEALGAIDALGRDADLLAELFRLASHDRDQFLADPRRVPVPIARLLSSAHAGEHAAAARARRTDPGTAPVASTKPTGDTIAVVAGDADGYGAVVIQSIFHSFGSGILDPASGVILQNRGAFFSLDPASPNVLAPGKRPVHTLMPVMVRRNGRVIGLHGTMGGKVQPQIHAQLILRTQAGEHPADAIAAARFVVGGLETGSRDDVAMYEPGVPAAAIEALGRSGFDLHALDDLDENVGHAQLVRRTDDGTLQAGSDPRADGAALAV